MASPPIFPTFFDPEQGLTSSQLLLCAKLHLLLFDSLAIQDNFLVSKLVAGAKDSRSKRSPLCDWIERGWLKVALREGVYSLTDLKEQMRAKTRAGDLVPFEREAALRLYGSHHFNAYLRNIDACLSTDGAIKVWSPPHLGKRLRKFMKHSAEDGSSGLPIERAVAIWNEIDRRASGETHSRSKYFEHSYLLPEQEAKLVQSWVWPHYIQNLPHALGFDISMPREALKSGNIPNPITEPDETERVADPTIVTGQDCVLLTSKFLSALTLQDIERLRRLEEFKNLTEAKSSGHPELLDKSLLTYLRAVSEEGPRIVNPAIRSLEAQVRFKRWLYRATVVLGAIMVAKHNPLGESLITSGIFLKDADDTESLLLKSQRETSIDLELQRPEYFLNFCHDADPRRLRTDDENRAAPPTDGSRTTARTQRKRRNPPERLIR